MSDLRPWVAVPRGKIRVYDGDTFYSESLDTGWGVSANKPKFRIARIDTPEKGWRAKTDRERELSLEAKKFVEKYITESEQVLVYTEDGRGKYGRWLIELVCDGVNVGDALIEAGLARRYDGGTKSEVPW
jgi:endonuclease YncB( thermonuclease family)|tara:strand:- start:81 stop:470 length:390 start_codon:yes stop_codon:yes gene_type:complete